MIGSVVGGEYTVICVQAGKVGSFSNGRDDPALTRSAPPFVGEPSRRDFSPKAFRQAIHRPNPPNPQTDEPPLRPSALIATH